LGCKGGCLGMGCSDGFGKIEICAVQGVRQPLYFYVVVLRPTEFASFEFFEVCVRLPVYHASHRSGKECGDYKIIPYL